MLEIRSLNAPEDRAYVRALADVLHDCVQGGASVSFMVPFSKTAAESFFEKVFDGVRDGDRMLLGAFLDSKLVGTVQVLTRMPPNQPHRAEIAKLLVLRSCCRQGIAERLMQEAEAEARAAGKTLLMLDTMTGGDAEKLYLRLGWVKAAVIPRYAMFPDGSWGDTTIFWKALSEQSL